MTEKPGVWAIAIGSAAGLLAFALLYQKASEIERRSTPVPVLVAQRYIPQGAAVEPGWAVVKQVPEAYVSPSALADPRSLEGLVALAPISSGEQLLGNKFGKPGDDLAATLEKGFRAYSLALDETGGVGGMLGPGDRVDLLFKGPSGNREAAGYLFQDLRVLAVGGRTTSRDATVGATGGYTHVTLSLTPRQAEEIFFLEGRSTLRLVLRCRGDRDKVSLPVADEGSLFRRLRSSGDEDEETP